jgi:hypothetical protein
MDDIASQISQLAQILESRPEMVDPALLKAGKEIIVIFNDHNYGPSIPKYAELMRALYIEAIHDLANGAKLLSMFTMGIMFKNGKLLRFSNPVEETDFAGEVVCSVKIKRPKFKSGEAPPPVQLAPEQINASIYLLTYLTSKIQLRR